MKYVRESLTYFKPILQSECTEITEDTIMAKVLEAIGKIIQFICITGIAVYVAIVFMLGVCNIVLWLMYPSNLRISSNVGMIADYINIDFVDAFTYARDMVLQIVGIIIATIVVTTVDTKIDRCINMIAKILLVILGVSLVLISNKYNHIANDFGIPNKQWHSTPLTKKDALLSKYAKEIRKTLMDNDDITWDVKNRVIVKTKDVYKKMDEYKESLQSNIQIDISRTKIAK